MNNCLRKRWPIGANTLPHQSPRVSFLLGVVCLWCSVSFAQAQETAANTSASPPNFTALSLEELMNYPVTSVAGHAEKKSETAAAVHIITQEDIRRSGATTIPEALRMAPGLDVARVDAH